MWEGSRPSWGWNRSIFWDSAEWSSPSILSVAAHSYLLSEQGPDRGAACSWTYLSLCLRLPLPS